MFKRLALVILALCLMSGVSYAATCYSAEILDADYNNVTTTKNSDEVAIQGFDKVAFFVDYDETEVGNSISAAVTCYISYDGDTWQQASFYDYAGGSTLQTSETISADGHYYFWFNKDLCVPYVRITVAATNTDADDLLSVNVSIAGKE